MPPRTHPHLQLVGRAGVPCSSLQGPARSDPVVVIDCDRCTRQHSDECDDCVVSYLVDHDPATPVVFGRQEQQAVELLADAGLIPRSRFESRHGVA